MAALIENGYFGFQGRSETVSWLTNHRILLNHKVCGLKFQSRSPLGKLKVLIGCDLMATT